MKAHDVLLSNTSGIGSKVGCVDVIDNVLGKLR
jgi:hypothetical protein